MSRVVIKVDNLSKLYRLGEVGTGTLSHDLNRWWAKLRGKEDPFLKLGAVNDRTVRSSTDYAWALKDIYFDVHQGDVLGIIGKNGAGKSTLLKLLSRVTSPTTGSIRAKGRIASLLEVGTGFHPELTGRENVYLNGAILGMTKAEIKRKFDEIVEFSGCAKYIDTPTKRYSSGMTVRLAFAVAAFLEAEILVVDEVLAVGDAEFQKKAIGKMKDVSSGEGRTVLFVSHNIPAIQSLCSRGIVLKNGQLIANNTIEEALDKYVGENLSESGSYESNGFTLESFEIINKEGAGGDCFPAGSSLKIKGRILGKVDQTVPFVLLYITGIYGERLVLFSSRLFGVAIEKFSQSLYFEIDIDSLMLMPGNYNFNLAVSNINGERFATWERFKSFEIIPDPSAPALSLPSVADRGIVYTRTKWNVKSDAH